MTKYRRKRTVIDATQWFGNGDHPEDGNEVFKAGEFKGELLEGKIVRYYRDPKIDGQSKCKCDGCHFVMHYHGWIDTLEGGHNVCPGDFIITDIRGEKYPCKPDIFHETYKSI